MHRHAPKRFGQTRQRALANGNVSNRRVLFFVVIALRTIDVTTVSWQFQAQPYLENSKKRNIFLGQSY